MTTYHIPKNEIVLDDVYIVLSRDPDGTEGIVSAYMPGIGSYPLVSGNLGILPIIRDFAQKVSSETGRPVYITKYKKLEVTETILPISILES